MEHWQVIALYLMIYDVIAVNAAYFLGLWFRFDCTYSAIPGEYLSAYLKFAPWYISILCFVFWALRSITAYGASQATVSLLRICLSTVITFLFQIIGITFVIQRMPMSYYLFGTIIQFCLITGIRFSYRFVLLERTRKQKEEEGPLHHIMLIGAGRQDRSFSAMLNVPKSQRERFVVLLTITPTNGDAIWRVCPL